MSYEAPYAGLKVIDVSQWRRGSALRHDAGPVRRHERHQGRAHRYRRLGLAVSGTRYGDHTAYSIPSPTSASDRSRWIWKQDTGRDVLWRLIRDADIFVQGFRPGVIDRLGFGYDAVAAKEPRILYLSVSGFGQKGPLAERPAMDPVLQAYTGMMSENRGQDGIPHRIPFISIDMSTAIFSFSAIAAALLARRHEPRGRHIDASLMQAAAGLQVVRLMSSWLEGGVTRPGIPPSGVYQTKDGFMSITVGTCRGSGKATARRSTSRHSAPTNISARRTGGSRTPAEIDSVLR